MPSGIKWYGNLVMAEVDSGMKRNMTAAVIYLSNMIKADISQPGTLRYSTGKGRKQKTIYNFTHSAPGNPPYKQTGRLRASIAWEVEGMLGHVIGRVGTNVQYGLYLEKGTRKMSPRPFLERNLNKHAGIVGLILTRRIDAGAAPKAVPYMFRSGILGRGASGYF